MPRRVRIVLCSRAGDHAGELPEIEVESPWWPDVEPVVTLARERFGVDLWVLRLLAADSLRSGGAVTYLAELIGASPLSLVPGREDQVITVDHPLRAGWARPGGVAAIVGWAEARLRAMARPAMGHVVQVKSWNLSSILRFTTAGGQVWCKSVPPFFAHEAAIIRRVGARDPSLVPAVLGHDDDTRTMLLSDVPGEDQREPSGATCDAMVNKFVALQASWAESTDELFSLGLPDLRSETLLSCTRALLVRTEVRAQFAADELDALDGLIAELPARLHALAACGLPDTLVHGDFHPGNWRGDGRALVLLDWGDCCVGHPMLDFAAFLPCLGVEARTRARATWIDAWRAHRPNADVARAADLIAPIAAVRQAIIYQKFLDNIEPSEQRYHATDVADWLRRALRGTFDAPS